MFWEFTLGQIARISVLLKTLNLQEEAVGRTGNNLVMSQSKQVSSYGQRQEVYGLPNQFIKEYSLNTSVAVI